MAAREGVGAALERRLRILEESAMDGGMLTLLFVRGISREINRKRVTSVEVNRISGKFVKRSCSFEESGQGWPTAPQRDLRQTKQLGVIWSSRTAH